MCVLKVMHIFPEKQANTLLCALLCLLWTFPAGAQAQHVSSGRDSVLFQADRVEDDVAAGRVILTGHVVLRHRDVELQAGRVVFYRAQQRLEAEALADSTGEKTVGVPLFIRQGERLSGSRMAYDLNTGQGQVRGGRATHQRKYYRGENILLNDRKELHAQGLSLSTCNLDHPHYDFLCNGLKVIEDDKAIGRSITFRIGPVPVFWLPFFVFPLQPGRHSGLLTPGVGSNSRDGFFVRNLGYYYAPNDYWDATMSATLRERGGILLASQVNYALRNRLSGAVDAAFETATTDLGRTSRNWRLNLRHQQRVSPTLNIRANGQFTSSADFDQRNSDDVYRYLNRQLRSSFSMDKQWTAAGRSLDASLTYYRDLTRSRSNFQGFPRLAFRQGRRPVFGRPEGALRTDAAWYHAIYYNFSGDLSNDFAQNPEPEDDLRDLALQGHFSVNSQHRPFGWLDLTPSLAVSQRFSHNNQVRPTRYESYTTSLSSGTTLYGIFRPQIGRLRGIRHRLQPRIDFRYAQSAQVNDGTFGFGGNRIWNDAQRSLNMNLGNTFEIKTEKDGREQRATFATLNFSTGYNFDIPASRWRPLRTAASVKPGRRLDIRLNMSHAFYDDLGRFSSPRLRTLTVTSNLRLRGGAGTELSSLDHTGGFGLPGSDFGFEGTLYGEVDDVSQPWRLNLTHYFDLYKLGATDRKRSWVKADVGFNPTRAWRVNYAINYDLMDTRVTAQSLSVYRDLHCWEASFSWYPAGLNKGFSFRINIKEIPQIGLSHRQGGFGF